jgi:hypothetical protein
MQLGWSHRGEVGVHAAPDDLTPAMCSIDKSQDGLHCVGNMCLYSTYTQSAVLRDCVSCMLHCTADF